jgi:hypothetical protein
MLGKKTVSYKKLQTAMENDLLNRFPAISQHIDAIHIEKGHLSAQARSEGIGIAVGDSMCTKEALPLGVQPMQAIRYEEPSAGTKKYIDKTMDSYIKQGKTEAEAHKLVQDSLIPVMGFDPATRQYVVSAKAPESELKKVGVTDSLLEQTSIQMWNVGWLTKIIKQPFATSHAKNLVSIESFNNPWADVIGLFKESFEGYGKLSNVARGNFKQNNSNPVSNEASQIVDEVFNISVDYESDIMEDIKAKQSGNFITGQIKADREKYAMMVLDRIQDALIYYGSDEAGIDGLTDVAPVVQYTGTPLWNIFTGNSTTRGSDIVRAMQTEIGNFLRENHYMAREVKINCSEYVFQALTQTVYSDTYNPDSPLQIIERNFNVKNELDGGLISVKYTVVSDTMLNPSISGGEQNPFNPNNYDLFVITVPSIKDAMGEQDSLIIHPELLKSYIVPALWQRTGMLYTMYKRIGGVIAPVEGTVKVIAGFGYQGN